MSRTDKFRLLRKLFLLVVLLAGFVVASSDTGVRQAAAAPCCSECEEWESYCYTLPEPDMSQCLDDVFRHCWRWCSFSC